MRLVCVRELKKSPIHPLAEGAQGQGRSLRKALESVNSLLCLMLTTKDLW